MLSCRFLIGLSALGLLAALSAPANAQQRLITEHRTPKGIRLVHYALPDDRQQALAFVFRDASIERTLDKAGLLPLAPLVMMSGGSKALDGGALSEDMVDLDVTFGLSRTAEITSGRLIGPPAAMGEAADLFRGLLTGPRLPPKHLERHKRAVLNDLTEALQKPTTIADEALERMIVGNQPQQAYFSYEPRTVITSVGTEDIDAWRKAFLARDTLTVAAVGPLSAEEAAALADRLFGDLPQTAAAQPRLAFKPVQTRKTVVIERPVDQSVLVMGAPTLWDDAEQATPRGLAMTILGSDSTSRLFIAIRETLGAAYGASAAIQKLTNGTHRFSMQASVAHDKLKAAREAMMTEYQRFRTEGVSDKDVAPLIIRFITRRAEAMAHTPSAASVIAATLETGLGPQFIMDYEKRVSAITAAELNEAIRTHLPADLTTIIVTPSAEGLNADCVIKDLSEISRCQ